MIIINIEDDDNDNDFDNDHMMITLFKMKKRLERFEELAQELKSDRFGKMIIIILKMMIMILITII